MTFLQFLAIILAKTGDAMAQVSAAEAKDQLANLLMRAEAGETVTVTRYGKPVAIIAPVPSPQKPKMTGPEMVAWLEERTKDMPMQKETGAQIIRQMRDEGY
jgi:prevent-host-death family protein